MRAAAVVIERNTYPVTTRMNITCKVLLIHILFSQAALKSYQVKVEGGIRECLVAKRKTNEVALAAAWMCAAGDMHACIHYCTLLPASPVAW